MTFAFAFSHRRKCVGRFAALCDREDERPVGHRRIAVSQFAGVFDFRRQACKLFQQVLAHQSRVPARAAGGQHDPVDSAQLLGRQVETTNDGRGFVVIDAAAKSVLDRLRLLEDFLQHVMFEVAEFDVGRHLIQRLDGGIHVAGRPMVDVQAFRLQDGNLVVGQIDDVLRVADQRAGVAGEEVLVPADSNHQWTAGTRGDQRVGTVAKEDCQTVSAFELDRVLH